MTDDYEKQIEILATKIMGWMLSEDGLWWIDENGYNARRRKRTFVGLEPFDPFMNPADGKMLDGRLIELGYEPRYEYNTEGDNMWMATLWTPGSCGASVASGIGKDLEVARAEAALQLPECEEEG